MLLVDYAVGLIAKFVAFIGLKLAPRWWDQYRRKPSIQISEVTVCSKQPSLDDTWKGFGLPKGVKGDSVDLNMRSAHRDNGAGAQVPLMCLLVNTSRKNTDHHKPDFYSGLFSRVKIENYGESITDIGIKECKFELARKSGENEKICLDAQSNELINVGLSSKKSLYVYVGLLFDLDSRRLIKTSYSKKKTAWRTWCAKHAGTKLNVLVDHTAVTFCEASIKLVMKDSKGTLYSQWLHLTYKPSGKNRGRYCTHSEQPKRLPSRQARLY